MNTVYHKLRSSAFALAAVLLWAVVATQVASAHSGWSYQHFSPTQGDVNAQNSTTVSLGIGKSIVG